ncbi:MAG: phosphatase PAP2 family protein [Thermoflexales bacterium]|nr:phosphatase PAP2 family protein [Thermoflexales bacterium]MDW8350438.1 phosphatase PAP2 family protein [Anaerolineae bacterium]
MHPRWGFIAVASFSALAVITMLVIFVGPLPGEWPMIHWALAARSDALTRLIWLLTFISSATPALLICVLASGVGLLRLRARRIVLSAGQIIAAGWPVIAFLGALACNIGMRIAIGRVRPSVDYIPHGLPELQADFQRFSYPSGHAGAAMVAFTALAMLSASRPRLRVLTMLGAALVIGGAGFGRVYLGVHWPTDVLAGYLLAVGWIGIGLYLRDKFG